MAETQRSLGFALAAGVLTALALAGILRFGLGSDRGPGGRVVVGPLGDVLAELDTGTPLVLGTDPPLAIVRYELLDPELGFADHRTYIAPGRPPEGAFSLRPREGLLALDLRDPRDRSVLAWCASAGRFEHAGGGARYGRLGDWQSGSSPRGLDRYPLLVDGGHLVVDLERWLAGPFRDSARPLAPAVGAGCS